MTTRWQRHGDTAADRLAADLARQLMAGPGFSRRGFLRTAGISAMALGGSGLLAACGTEPTTQTADTCVSTDLSETEKVLDFSNWPEYIDVAGKKIPTLDEFKKRTGITVNYTTDVNGNNEFLAKVRNQLGACEPTGRDIFVLTDWMAARIIGLGWLQELDASKMPNVYANMQDSLMAATWDPGRKYTIPWQSGLTGIAYNAQFTGPVESFEELVTRPDLKGKMTLLNEMADTMGFMLKLVGADPGEFTADQWEAAKEKLGGIVDSGQVRRFTGNDYIQPLNQGDIVACEAWSGDVIAMQFDNPDIKWVQPPEGLSLWSDNMMVPNKADHKTNAELLMDYYYEPEVAARLAAWVNYICPVKGAQEAMAKVDASLVDNALIFPTAEDLVDTWAFMSTDTKTRETYEKEFNQVIGA